MDSQLPLLDFLSSYPHPAFTLPALPLYEALTVHVPAQQEPIADADPPARPTSPDMVRTTPPPPSPRSVASSSRTATLSPPRKSSRASSSSMSRTVSGEPYTSTSSIPVASSPADVILATAFTVPPSSSAPVAHPLRSTMLEGGSQADHHPSRTAEGAVTAMYEQKAAEEGRRAKAEEAREKSRRQGAREGQWAGGRAGGAMGKTLAELLTPEWGNDAWRELIRRKDGDEGLGLLALLGRKDAQKLLALLVDAVASLKVEGSTAVVDTEETKATPTHSATLQLTFPFDSIHHRSLAARNAEAAGHQSLGAVPESNAYRRPQLTPLRPIVYVQSSLDVVATLMPGTNLVIITTTSHNIYTPPIVPPTITSPPATPKAFSISRPPLYQRNSSLSSNSSASTLQAMSVSSSGAGSLTSSTTLISDRIPAPIPEYSGQPTGFPGKMRKTSGGGSTTLLFEDFLVENRRKKTEKRERRERRTVEDAIAAAVEEEEVVESSAGEEAVTTDTDEPDSSVAEDSDAEPADAGTTNQALEEVHTPFAQLPTPQPAPLMTSFFPVIADPFLAGLARTPMGRMISEFPWGTTPLGPIGKWERELKVIVSLTLASPFTSAIWWGEHSVLIYNDEYVKTAATKHPAILGQSGALAWAEIWEIIGPLSARVMEGETISFTDHYLPMLRNGFVEETYHIWAFIPFCSSEGAVLGYHNPSFETTARVVAERRLGTIADLVHCTNSARTVSEYCTKAIDSISTNPYDLPFALLYTCEDVPHPKQSRRYQGSELPSGPAEPSASMATVRLTLQGTVGVPEDHESAPAKVIIKFDNSSQWHSSRSSNSSFTPSVSASSTQQSGTDKSGIWPFHEACSSKKPVFIDDLAGRADGFESRGWPDVPTYAVVIPIVVEGDVNALPRAVLIVGLNPRRPWNDIFATFLLLLSKQISSGLSTVTTLEADARRAEELLALDRAKSNFFSNVSHELRTPLTLILGPLDDILSAKDNLQTPDRDRLTTVQRHANRLLNMVNTLLDFSRLEGGRMEVLYRPCLLGAMTADLASLFRAAIERGKIEFIVDCEADPQEGRHIYLASELWEKIVFNLIGNAYKYTMSGKIVVKVTFTAKEGIFQVIDTGCGIADTEIGRIFDRFHRVEGASRTQEGTGIGLALTRELVKVLGGTLEVESELGKGSTFTVKLLRGSSHLPLDQVVTEGAPTIPLPPLAQYNLSIIEDAASWRLDAPGSRDMRERVSSTASTPSSNLSSAGDDGFLMTADLLDLKSSTVLLVDDNTDLRKYIAGTLSKAFTVVQREDGQSALEYALKKPPSLVVTDVMMSRLDGNGLLKALRSNPSTALIPVIFLSADASPEVRVSALLAGADDYLCKPFQSRELLARVNVHLQLSKMRLELERRVEERTRALIESEMRYRGLADRYSTLSLLSPVGIFMATADGSMSYANPRFYEISGHAADKPLSEWRECVLPDDLHLVDAFWLHHLNSASEAQSNHMEFRWRGGNWSQLEIRPFHESGAKRGHVGAITDISQIKRVEALHMETVEQRAADAEENRRESERYIDMVSHELRNPLSAVWQNSQLLSESLERIGEVLDDWDPANPDLDALRDIRREVQEDSEAVDSIILASSHQGKVADDILNVSKLSMNMLNIERVPFQLSSKIGEVLRMYEVECQQKQIALSLSKGASIADLDAEWIVADPSRIAQVAINFITNSVKCTSESKVRTIVVELEAFDEAPPPSVSAMRVSSVPIPAAPPGHLWIVVGVKDSGKGLSEDDLKKLFARFSQANPKSDSYGGSGLGLYVSKKLVELHSGFIEVESTPGHGSTFRFAIPCARGRPAGTDTPEVPRALTSFSSMRSSSSTGRIRQPSKTTKLPDNSKLEGSHILVVEDNAINQSVMRRQLKLASFVVTIASNGQEALDILMKEDRFNNTSPIRVVLMDIEMPIMDGLTAIKELRERERTGVIPIRYSVIAVTGNARQSKSYCALGFDDVAIKPYRFAELLQQIQKVGGYKAVGA